MSYEHLAGRLVETQRSMIGQPAIEIAQSVDGLAVTDDGNVTGIDGDRRAVVDELVSRYADMLGGPARTRLRTAAAEFEEELVLPASLGGPDDPSEDAAGKMADVPGATIEVESPGESGGDGSDGGSVVVEYTTQGNAPGEDDDADLASVYLMTEDEHDWKTPITVADAIADAVTSAADLGHEDIGTLDDYVETERVLSVLGSEGAVSVSFDVEGRTVTLHPSGTVRVE